MSFASAHADHLDPDRSSHAEDPDETLDNVLLADGMEAAFLGIGYQFTKQFAVYSKKRALEALMKQGMTYEESVEYFDFNVQGAYVGEHTPVFIDDENPVEL
jgi:hypothetical protein